MPKNDETFQNAQKPMERYKNAPPRRVLDFPIDLLNILKSFIFLLIDIPEPCSKKRMHIFVGVPWVLALRLSLRHFVQLLSRWF